MAQKVNKKRGKAAKKKFDELAECLTRELYEIAMGHAAGDDGEPAGIKERLKAAELLNTFQKNSEKQPEAAATVVIIDDIGEKGG